MNSKLRSLLSVCSVPRLTRRAMSLCPRQMNVTSLLLLTLTEQSDVMRHRIDAVLELTSAEKAIDSGPLWSLIRSVT